MSKESTTRGQTKPTGPSQTHDKSGRDRRDQGLRRELLGLDFADGEARLAPQPRDEKFTGVVIDPGAFNVHLDWPFNMHRDMVEGSVLAGDGVREPTKQKRGLGKMNLDIESALSMSNPKTFSTRDEASAHAGSNPYLIDDERMFLIKYEPGHLQVFLKSGVREELAAINKRDKVSDKVAIVVEQM